MNKKILTFTILLSLLFPNLVKAECDNKDEYFESIKDQFKVTYETDYELKQNVLILNNPHPESYFMILVSYGEYSCNAKGEYTKKCTNIKPGEYEIKIYNNNNYSCSVGTINFTLPWFNEYYNDDLCKGLEDFYLCQPDYDKEIDYDTFKSRIELYINKQDEKTENDNDIKKNIKQAEEKFNIIEYINNNLATIIIITIFVILTTVTIILTINSERKRRVLK